MKALVLSSMFLILAKASVTLSVAAAGELLPANGDPLDKPLLSVNGRDINAVEFGFYAQHSCTEVYQYFYDKHGIEDSLDYWSSKKLYDTESPVAMLKNRTIAKLVRSRVQLELASKLGIIESPSYESILRLRERENERRVKSVRSGQVVYGPKQYSLFVFFDHFLSNTVIELKRRLANGSLHPELMTDDEVKLVDDSLEEAYEALIDRLVSMAVVELYPNLTNERVEALAIVEGF